MPHFKDLQNNLHFIEKASLKHLLPLGSVEISDDEANQIRNPPLTDEQQVNALKSELRALEVTALMPRGAREAFIALCLQQGAAANLTPTQLYAVNPFFKGLKDTDEIAAGLRAQIKELS